jgi:hypothetical protein
MTDDTSLPFSFPAVSRKKITASFDGGKLTSDGGRDRTNYSFKVASGAHTADPKPTVNGSLAR